RRLPVAKGDVLSRPARPWALMSSWSASTSTRSWSPRPGGWPSGKPLLILAVLDGAFSGFRSSAGRTGLISHRRSDYRAARRGAGLAAVLLAPVITVVCADVLIRLRLPG
ncbi:MAG: hypothetical protein ACRDRJ_23875, partial [Streptosporangiaceae bacterium]